MSFVLSRNAQAAATPVDDHLIFTAPGWSGEISQGRVAACELYNTIEIRREWHEVVSEWDKLVETRDGWRLPCRVDIPFVGTVITFEIIAVTRPDLSAVELSIPDETLTEHEGGYARLLRIDLLPDMAAARPGDDGYLLLPCYCGVLHNFRHDVSREERIVIYSEQTQWAMRANFNCIGMNRDDLSWCAIVTEGEFDAEAVVRSHYGHDHTYSAHIGLVYRWDPSDNVLWGDRTVRFYLLDPREGGWSAFARCYRTFLRAERGVRTWSEKAGDHPHVLPFARSFVMKIMQGYKKDSLDGAGQYQSATTFSEARGILERLQSDGITGITAQMVGWNREGHDGRYPTRFPVNEVEGGESGFRELIEWGRQNGVVISAHDNYSDSYVASPDFSYDDVIELRDGALWRNVPWAGGFNWRMCPKRSIRHAKRDLPRMKELGLDGNYYLDAVAAFTTCHSSDHPANRAEIVAAFREIFTYTRGLFGTFSTEVVFGPYFDLMDGVYMDWTPHGFRQFTDFPGKFVDETVPFLPIALHNSVRYHCHNASGKAGALGSLAWGAMPFIEISARRVPGAHGMPLYDDVREYALEGYRLCCDEFVDVVERDLDNVEMVSPEALITSFADGLRLLVNAGSSPTFIDGKEVAPLTAVRS